MLLGAIADDFTGASDLANTLAKGGMSTVQFVGSSSVPVACEAGVVALKTRSVAVEDAVRESVKAARWLLDQGCEQIIFKYCSTFDSTPQGNIGPVAEALLDLLGADVAVVCPAFPATGRRLFMGHLFVGDRLLNESGMEKHPLTPMTDPNIRRWLGLQTKGEVGSVSLDTVRKGRAALEGAFEIEKDRGRRLVVTDAVDDDDLRAIGAAAAGHKLITGGSGIALGLPQNFRSRGKLAGSSELLTLPRGPGIVLCGSCSATSLRQVAHFLKTHPGFALDPAALLAGDVSADGVYRWILEQGDRIPIIYSTATPEAVSNTQAQYGREAAAAAIEGFFGDLVRTLVQRGTRRIVVGGGETSGAVVEALDLNSLRIGPEIDPGVPALLADLNGPLGLALKSGNFGSDDFFEKAIGQVGST